MSYKLELINKAKKELAKVEYETALLERVIYLLPADLPIKRVHTHTYKGDVTIEMTVNERLEAVDLSRITGTIPLVLYKNGCTSIFPLEKLTDKQRENGSYCEIEPFFWWEAECHYWGDGHTEAKMKWFFKVEDLVVMVKCAIKQDPTRIWEKITRNSINKIIERKWQFENFPLGELIQYYSGQHGKPGVQLKYNIREMRI